MEEIYTSKKYTPKQLKDGVDSYYGKCKYVEQVPDYAGMLIYLDIFEDDVQAMCEDPVNGEQYRRIFQRAQLQRESWLVRRMVNEPKAAQGCMNALKELKNGGYSAKKAENTDRTLTIKLEGVGEDAYK